MTHIKTDFSQYGMTELIFYKKETGSVLSELAHTLLQGKSPLSMADREIIATHVSILNDCEFCTMTHGVAATTHLGDDGKAFNCMIEDISKIPVSDKMKKLLAIATKVHESGKAVTEELVKEAREAGACDEEIHDTVLIAAAFCMFNRYVDGLGTMVPEDKSEYKEMGERLAKKGYRFPPFLLAPLVKRLLKK